MGLGNPGPDYADTRHNVGQLVARILAERIGATWKRHRTGRADVAEARLATPGAAGSAAESPPQLVVMRPRSYMNESGGPVAAVARYTSIAPDHLIAVHDELDLDRGALRVKLGGGDNGHNGLRSMRRSLGTGDFFRVRVGIGRPPGRQDPTDFVLSSGSAAERRDRELTAGRAADAVVSIIARGLSLTQSDFND